MLVEIEKATDRVFCMTQSASRFGPNDDEDEDDDDDFETTNHRGKKITRLFFIRKWLIYKKALLEN